MDFIDWLIKENEIESWLGDSVIRQPVYHGTSKQPFDKFDYQKSNRYILFSAFEVETNGFFFAENPHDAFFYGDNVVTCYVKMRNPFVDPRRDKHLGVDRLPYQKELELMKILAPLIEREDGEPFMDIGVSRYYLRNHSFEFAHQWVYYALENNGLSWDVLDNKQCVANMVTLGYDGTFVEESEQSVGRSIFVPSADQIKIVGWASGEQPEWGHPDDYYIKQSHDGLSHLYRDQEKDEDDPRLPTKSEYR